jgi:hypothetical protein
MGAGFFTFHPQSEILPGEPTIPLALRPWRGALLAARRPGHPLVFLQNHPAGAELAEIAFLVLAGDGEGAQDIVGVGLLQGPNATLAPGGVGNLPDRTRPDPGFPYPGNVCSCPGKSLPHYLSPRVLSRA